MALDFMFWPESLPVKALLDGFAPTIPSNIVRAEMDAGAARQHSRGDVVIEPIAFAYYMDETQLNTFREFCKIIGGRSFWIIFPNPKDPGRYVEGKYRYFRIKGNQDVISDPEAEGGGKYTVSVTFEFWCMVPAMGKEEIQALQDSGG